jgi:hypothetical protein
MLVLRQIFALAFTAGVLAATAAPAEAASPCKQGPPAWWNAPRVSYTYNGQRTHSYDTAPPTRRASSYSYSSRSASTRSSYRSYSAPRYAHSRGYSEWR